MFQNLTPKQQRWRQIWPSGFIALLAVIQLVLTFIIIGLETTSMIFDMYHSMIFAGFYCSLFFMITWISMFTVTCCNRHSLGCATHVLVESILSAVAASVLLYFDNLFLNNPFTCFYGSYYDCSLVYGLYDSNGIYNSTNYTVKLACIKAQLACAAVMFVTNVIYIIIFIVVAVKTRNENNVAIVPYGGAPGHVLTQPMIYQTQPSTIYVPQPQQATEQRVVECQNCHTLIPIV